MEAHKRSKNLFKPKMNTAKAGYSPSKIEIIGDYVKG